MTGPIVLAGHAYAGAVIGATRNEKVRALVYIAALAPDEGETVADVSIVIEPHPQAPKLAPDGHGLIWLPSDAFAAAFAQHASAEEQALLACGSAADIAGLHQRQARTAAVEGPAELVPVAEEDRMIVPDDPALHGGQDEGARAITPGRSYADRHRAQRRRGHYPRCRPRRRPATRPDR